MLKTFILIVAIVYLSYSSSISIAVAPERKLNEYTVPELIQYFSKQYGSSSTELTKVMLCESGGKVVWGDNYHARGVYQYWQPTWDSFSKEFGEKLDRESTYDQVKLTSWAFAKGYKHHWTCSRITGVV
jgi:hypothetical protein